jgi:hypothetical protein
LATTVAAGLLFTAGTASAQGVGVGASMDIERIPAQRLGPQRWYMAKLLCGTIQAKPGDPQAPAGPLLAPGTYLSRINIHHLSLREPQTFDVYVTAGQLQQVITRTVQPFGSATVDCGTVIALFDPLDPFVERSIAISTPVTAGTVTNVVAVYTFKNVEPDPPAQRDAP